VLYENKPYTWQSVRSLSILSGKERLFVVEHTCMPRGARRLDEVAAGVHYAIHGAEGGRRARFEGSPRAGFCPSWKFRGALPNKLSSHKSGEQLE